MRATRDIDQCRVHFIQVLGVGVSVRVPRDLQEVIGFLDGDLIHLGDIVRYDRLIPNLVVIGPVLGVAI